MAWCPMAGTVQVVDLGPPHLPLQLVDALLPSPSVKKWPVINVQSAPAKLLRRAKEGSGIGTLA